MVLLHQEQVPLDQEGSRVHDGRGGQHAARADVGGA